MPIQQSPWPVDLKPLISVSSGKRPRFRIRQFGKIRAEHPNEGSFCQGISGIYLSQLLIVFAVQMSGISAMRKCYSCICDEVALENTKTPFSLASHKNQALPDPYNRCIPWFQKVTLPRNNLQKYFLIVFVQYKVVRLCMQRKCYVTYLIHFSMEIKYLFLWTNTMARKYALLRC